MKKEFHLTQSGIDALKVEVKDLIGRRSGIAEKLKVARDHGDLKENSEYHNARDEQGQVEDRISEIEHILRNVEVIKKPQNSEIVELGDTVVLKGEKGTQTYTIVGSVESNPLENKISDESPIGQALMGVKVGEPVTISLPAGDLVYKVTSIK